MGQNPVTVGQFQAISDGAGGIWVVDSMQTRVIKHIYKTERGIEFEYVMPTRTLVK